MTECRHCGNEHDVTELCRPRRVNRRMFLFTLGAAAAATALPSGIPMGSFPGIDWVPFDGVPFRGYPDDAFIGNYTYEYLVMPRPIALAYNALLKEDHRYVIAHDEPEPVRRLRDVQRRG